jgi:hypothetical protein
LPRHSIDTEVFTLMVAMQRLCDAVRRGYVHYFSGVVPVRRARRLRCKFQARYNVDEHRNIRARRRARGEAAAVLIMHELPTQPEAAHACGEPYVGWIVLLTEGEHAAYWNGEDIKTATEDDQRLVIGQFQMLRRTRPGGSASSPSWTWAFTRAAYQDWRERVVRSARGDYTEPPARLLLELYRWGSFRGIRSDIGRIVSLYRREWRKRRRRSDSFPSLPRLRYVQRLRNEFVDMDSLMGTLI